MNGGGEAIAPLVAIAFSGFHIAFARWLLRGLRGPVPQADGDFRPLVSVLVAARDERSNLERLVPALLAQDYPAEMLQLVVVDDRSTDGTAETAHRLGEGRVEVVTVRALPEGVGPKKHALATGLACARGEIVLQIDADNRPGPGWISSMVGCFGSRTGAVCGLVFHAPRAASTPAWFHGIWAVEALGWGAVQEAAIGAGTPISANGGNLAYRRKAFDEVGGFSQHQRVVSGDDDFLVQSMADTGRWEVVSARSPDSEVLTAPPADWREVWEQRKRWGSKCIRYDPKRVGLLAMVYASYAWIALVGLAGLWNPWLWIWAAIPFALVMVEAFELCRVLADRTGRRDLLAWFPLAAAIQIPVVLVATAAGTFGKFRWKDGPTGAVRRAGP